MVNKKILIEDVTDRVITWREVYLKDNNNLKDNFIHEYKPTAGDRIYIFPDSSVPRFKLKSFCDKHNVAISKTREKANILVGDPEKLLNNIGSSRMWVDHHIFKQHLLNILRKLPDTMTNGLTQAVENSTENTFILGRNFSTYLEEKLYFKFIDADDVEKAIEEGLPVPEINYEYEYNTICIVDEDQEAEYVFILSSKIYHQDALNSIVSEENVIIDEELYNGFKSLLNSGNREDHQIAMEGMANSNYKESITYLLLLFYEFHNTLWDHPSKHHVNFKSLVKYLDLGYKGSIGIDGIVKCLRDKKLLTSKNMNIVMTEAKQVVLNQGETECFKVTGVAPSDEIQQIIDETDASLLANQPTIEQL